MSGMCAPRRWRLPERRLGVRAVSDHALVAPDRGPPVVERGSGVAPALPGQLIGPAIPLLDMGLKLRGRQIVPRDSTPAKDQHELAPQGTFLASRSRHHGSQPYPPPRLIEPRHRASGPTQAARPPHLLELAQVPPDLACPACRLDTGGGHPMLMLRDKTEQRDGRVNDDDMRVSGTRAIARLSRLRCVTGPGLGSARE
jgi:hypothetical protein